MSKSIGVTDIIGESVWVGTSNVKKSTAGVSETFLAKTATLISLVNFPGHSDIVIEGEFGAAVPGTRSITLDSSDVSGLAAGSGKGFQTATTFTGCPSGSTCTGDNDTGITVTNHTVSATLPSTFPEEDLIVDYNDLTLTLGTKTTVNTYTYTFTGNLGRTTSCKAFAGGSTCPVYSNTDTPSGTFGYFTSNASGAGGYGAQSCSQGCSLNISANGSSSCNTNGNENNASISAQLIGCGELNTYGVAADTSSSGPSCAHGNTIRFEANGTHIASLTPNNSGNYNQYVLSASASNNYAGQTIVGYAKGVDVTSAFYGGGDFVVSAGCGNP